MKLTILGATGKTGLHVVRQALERGYEVSVLVRTPGKLGELRGQVTIVEGDVTDYNSVKAATRGANAVLSVIGYTRGTEPGLFSLAMQNTIRAMQEAHIRRLVWLTGVGVPAAEDTPGLLLRMLNGGMQLVAGPMIRDASDAARLIQASGLDWTIVRVPLLRDTPGSGRYQVGMPGYAGMQLTVPREDAARFLLDALAAKRLYGKLPMVSAGAVRVKK